MAQVTKNLQDGVIKLVDGVSYVPNELEVIVEEGNLTFNEKKEPKKILDRGKLSHLRGKDEEPVTGSFSIKFVEFISQVSPGNPTLYEVLNKIGEASSWITTNTDGGDVYTLTAKFEIATPTSGEKAERVTFALFYPTSIDFKEGDEFDELTVEFEAFITAPTIEKYE